MKKTQSRKPKDAGNSKGWSPAAIFLVSILLGLALFTFIFGDLVTRIFVVLIVLMTLHGYFFGAAKAVASMAAMMLAIPLAGAVGRLFEVPCSNIFGTTGLINRMVCIGVGGVAVMVIVGTILSILIGIWLKRRPGWRKADRGVGGVVGLLEGCLLGVLVIWAVLVIEPIAAQQLAHAEISSGVMRAGRGARWVVSAADAVHQSAVGRAAGHVNPLKEMRLLRIFGSAQTVLNDQVMRERFVNHPNMREIAELPAIKKAQELLLANSDIVNFEDGLTPDELQTLMRDPRLLKILDESGIFADMSSIGFKIEQAFEAALEPAP